MIPEVTHTFKEVNEHMLFLNLTNFKKAARIVRRLETVTVLSY